MDQPKSYFDIVLACDVLVYLGDLKSVLDSVHQVLKPGGVFAFSTELLQNNRENHDFVLHECARFSHSSAYLERLAASGTSTFQLLRMVNRVLRKNRGDDVMGNLTILQKLGLTQEILSNV